MRARGGCGRALPPAVTHPLRRRHDITTAVAAAPPPRARGVQWRCPATARMASPPCALRAGCACAASTNAATAAANNAAAALPLLPPRAARGAACACACAASNTTTAADTPPPTPATPLLPPRVAPSFALATPPGDEHQRSVCTTCGFVDYKNPKVVVAALVVSSPAEEKTFRIDDGARIDDGTRRAKSAHLGRVLLCRRAIAPSAGRWGFPQGYLELGERARAGAAREAHEECGARVTPGPLLAVYDVPGCVLLVYLARFRRSPALGPRPETSEVAWFDWCAHLRISAAFFARLRARFLHADTCADALRARCALRACSLSLSRDALPAEEELAFPTVAWALARARAVLERAPEGAWPPWDEDSENANESAQNGGGGGDGGAWFAPQQRAKCAAPPGYVEE
jgi:ADP-ribose pyrophosphatase YjhB (NUDIX family)